MQIGLLGAVEVTKGDVRVPVGGQRLRAVLARLALDAGRLVTVGALVDAVWGDDPPSGAVNALQSLVSRLRRTLPEGLIESVPAGYRVALPPDAVDAHRFERLAGAGRRALTSGDPLGAATTLQEALALWRGPALADVGDAPFRAAAAARLDNARLAALEDRIDADLALDRHPDVVAELEALTAEHPLRERPHAQLMLALNGSSQQAEALATYDRIRRRLADELGMDPGPVLSAAHATVLGGPTSPNGHTPRKAPPKPPAPAPAPAPASRNNLRPQLTSFVGRRDELAEVAELLAAERLVTLIGPGGAGKTRLAEESGARLADRSPGGVWMVGLAPVGDGGEVPQTILNTLGRRQGSMLDRVDSPPPQDVLVLVTKALSAGPTLLVLDNCEHLISAVAELAHSLLLDCPELRILATSREPLGVPGEHLHPVPSLALPPDGKVTPAQAARYPAVQLLVDRAAAVRSGFALDPKNVDAVVEICRRLDGMPLALELAAARLRSVTPEQLADRLGDRFRLLTGGSRTALPRHQTLRAVVAWSWDLLNVREQALWRRLSIFPAGATLEAAEQVCADDAVLPAGEVLDTLASLVDKSLVETVDPVDAFDTGPPRYRMLETVRAYGAERLEDAGEAVAVRDALLDYYEDFVQKSEPKLRTAEQAEWTARLTIEYENISAAMRWAIDQRRGAAAVHIAASLTWYLALRGAHQEVARWTKAVLPLADDVDPVDRAIIAAFAGLSEMGMGQDYEVARERAKRTAAEIAPFATDPNSHPVLVLADTILAFLAEENERVPAALVRARASDDPWIRALALFLEAQLRENDGNIDLVEPLLEQARAEFTVIGDRWGRGAALGALASIKALRGDHAGAIDALEEANVLLTELQGLDDQPRVLLWLALEWARVGDEERAQQYVDETRAMFAHLGDDVHVRGFLSAIEGSIRRLFGDVEAAAEILTAELARYRANPYGPPQIKSLLLADYCYVLLDVGRLDEARENAHEALDVAEESRDSPILGGAVDSAAAVVLALGDPGSAAVLLGAAATIRGLPDLGSPDVARTRTGAGDALGAEQFEARYREGEQLARDDIPKVAHRLLTSAGDTPPATAG
ncbi:BTAD domain-containing putative transcriptional regulator [Cryptosporangium phraense]|uniref:BTAD domain-containing putative transcriptional regulator n=1 Tax=Cryptosporangium phraense TaxID=2593070 RepID=UPI0014795526|nr:BTAD domain-containing putative transcriptional regulator [Cryptosporangium phraense]